MENFIYLNNGSTSFPKPSVVHDFMCAFYRDKGVSPGRSACEKGEEADSLVAQARQALTELFGGDDPNRLCFTYNATDSLNLIINGLVNPGDHVVTTVLEHNSVLRPLYNLYKDAGVEVDYVPCDSAGYVDPDDIASRIRLTTRLVVINHGSNVFGTVQDVGAIGRACRERDVTFAIDAAQTAGVVEVDAAAAHIDAVAFTGHKSLFGPTGIGGVYVSERAPLRPTRFGGTGIKSALRTQPQEYPYRLEAGTLNTLGIAGLFAGVGWINEQGITNIREHEITLWTRLRDGLAEIPGVILYAAGSPNGRVPVLSFNVEGTPPEKVGEALVEGYRIASRTGLHCAPLAHETTGTDKLGGTVRFSLGPFNTEGEVDRTVAAVAEIAARSR